MQFSESWLRSLCNPALNTEELCHLLTMAGLEVEEMEPVAAPFSDVVVGQILTAEKHPDADRLKLCNVDVGSGTPLQIVCGAPNAATGLKVPCALVGAKLPGMDIRRAKVRGIESSGMLCSARELGLSQDHEGLLVLAAEAPVGISIREFLGLEDTLITLKLTPNRADCLSLLGIARELSALTGAPLNAPVMKKIVATNQDTRQVLLDAPDACPRYCGRIVRGVSATAPTPEWMKRRIERSGIRAISALVDITNYVMLELGQPLHAFDNRQLDGAIHVRYPTPGEQFRLLNEQVVTPSSATALIADDAKPLALAGIMGGEHSGISDTTTDLFLESAFFTPVTIAGKARALGFSSDASHRYERGVDFELQARAIERATELIVEICAGSPGPVVEAVNIAHLPLRPGVTLRPHRANQVLGITLEIGRMASMLGGLGLQVEQINGTLRVTPPPARFDISIEEDLIEELARLYGYDNVPSNPPVARIGMMPVTETQRSPMTLRHLVAERGYHEIVNYSFVEARWEADFAANSAPIVLANPIASQMGVMRSTLFGGLIAALGTNLRRQSTQVRLFEIGRCFLRSKDAGAVAGFTQPLRLGGLAAGSAQPEQWGTTARAIDFFDVKADIEALLQPRQITCQPAQHPALHPGRSANILVDGQIVGVFGELHPRWVHEYELGKAPVLFEIELTILQQQLFPMFQERSKFPFVIRDLALVVNQSQPLQPLLDCLRKAAPAIVKNLELFDVYQGKGLEASQKSLAFHIVMQDTHRTLEDAEADAAMSALLQAVDREFGALLRR